jgi:hypothetical protein
MATITIAQVKQFTTLTGADDATITAMIPIIDSKVRLVTRNRWNYQVYADLVTGETDVQVYGVVNYAGIYLAYGNSGINANWEIDDIGEWLEVGAQLSGNGIASGTYIEEIFYNGPDYEGKLIPVIRLSQAATATGQKALQLGIPLAYVPTIAKGVQWLIEQATKSSSSEASGVKSKSIGPVSVSYAEKDVMIDGLTGMPSWFVKGLPRYHGGH